MEPPTTVPVIDLDKHEFIIPTKQIKGPEEIASIWEKSQAYHDLLGFICALSDAVKGKKLTDDCHVSEVTNRLVNTLNILDKWIDEIPPIDQPQRFGNTAYREWFQRLQENAEPLVSDIVGPRYSKAVPEISLYLVEGVGNSTRIDYGTGHELTFVAFLLCLFKLGVLTQQDAVATVAKTFSRYLELARKLQITYHMEPAGSQGVWNLDDFQFIPFIWGSSQLIEHQRLKPKSFPDPDICSSFAKDYMFLGCIKFIMQVKTGPFAEHSNQLWNISGVPQWSKVNAGLVKMYRNEVLNKFPVIQHFIFGSLLTTKPAQVL